MLRLPTAADELPPLVVQGHPEDQRSDVPPVTEEPNEHGRVKKRRRSSQKKEQVFDETFARKEEMSPKLVRGLIGSVALCGAILVVALLWPSGGKTDDGGADIAMPMPVEDLEPEKDELAIKAENSTVSPILVEAELQPVFETFLNARSPEEMAKWVRHPEITLPRIQEFYGEDFAPDGFSSIIWGQAPQRSGKSIRVSIQDGNFSRREIHLVDEDGWKVDWESWAGWSEMSWEELKKTRPTKPVLLRVVVSDVSYYNFDFTDEARWSSYRLESSDGEQSLYAYVPRAGVLDARLKSLEGVKERLLTVKAHYPEDAPSESQLIVDEIVTDGWLVPDDEL